MTSSDTVGTQVDSVQVQVQVTGRIPSYSRSVLNSVAGQLLAKQALTLGAGYRLQGTPSVSPPHVDVQGKDGLIYLNVTVHGTWSYAFTSEQESQWRQNIKGATPAAAIAYLQAQEGIAGVQTHLPFQADHFPTNTNDITITIVGDN